VIAHAPTREEAAHRLARVLSELRVHGVTTNRDLLLSVLRHPGFLAGDTTTDFIDRYAPPPRAVHGPETVRRAAIQAALASRALRRGGRLRLPVIPAGWRNNRSAGETTMYEHGGEHLEVSFWEERDGKAVGTAAGTAFTARVYGWSDPWLDAQIEGRRDRVSVTASGGTVWVHGPGGEVRLLERPRFPSPQKAAVAGALTAPMNGLVLSVAVSPGDRVAAGQTLVIIEAMKMEHRMAAPADGTVTEVLVSPGSPVSADQLLAVMEPDEVEE
jgi:propionyl-CoA carboxylase alpha chain